MATVGPGRRFREAAAEWGLDEITEEDAQWACPATGYEQDGPRWRRDEVAFAVCDEALLAMTRPGRWDRW